MTARDDLIHALARDSAAAPFAGDMYGLGISELDVRDATEMVDSVINEALADAAEKIRAAYRDMPPEFWAAKSTGAACANLIDPAMEAKREASREQP